MRQNTKSEIDKNIRGKIIKELKDYNYVYWNVKFSIQL